MTGRERICVALDVPDPLAATRLAAQLAQHVGMLKVGLELFVAHGRAAVDAVRGFGLPIFLDLKLHDIPQTVESAARGAAQLGVQFVTVHASGGPQMIAAARRGLGSSTKMLAVTVLTSLGAEETQALGFPADAVIRFAKLALDNGADGLVCSPKDVASLREAIGPKPILVVPGIRPAGSEANDQKRTGTPAEAVKAGATYLVIGRPLRDAADPGAAADAIAASL
jgi:orotidine-5'-phosphate decarboxylase